MNLLSKLINFKKNIKHLDIYQKSSQIVLVITQAGKKNTFVSSDGFDFTLSTKKFTKPPTSLNYSHLAPILVPGSEYISPQSITVQGIINTPKDKLLFYHYQKDNRFYVGLAGLGANGQLIWRHPKPVWISSDQWQNHQVIFLAVFRHKRRIISYWHIVGLGVQAVVYPHYSFKQSNQLLSANLLYKPPQNPLISPNPSHSWEAFTTFNPAAIYEADKIHLLYRAQGFDYRSVLGYATSTDGYTIDYRQSYPCYIPSQPFEQGQPGKVNTSYISGGGCQGCEDPRITRIGDRIYMTYVAFNGWDPPRIALTSIALSDFLAHRWLWERPVLISPPNPYEKCGKSACILPEKIGGKYVIFHRIFPNILIDFVDSLDFVPGQYLQGQYKITPRSPLWWDSRKIGTAAPPLKTNLGWLLIYQSVDDKDASCYLVGAMILKIDDPTQVLVRSVSPIIRPDMWYDNQGFKSGVVYPCGAVIKDGTLFVYYGGADSHVCLATANLDQFLANLINQKPNQLDPVIIKKL